MKSFEEAKKAYIKDHLEKALEQPDRRLNALKAIEKRISENLPELLREINLFERFEKQDFERQYEKWKGSSLSGAEKSVIVGLYRFS